VDACYAYGNEPGELEFEPRPIDSTSHASSPYESSKFVAGRVEQDCSGLMAFDLTLLCVSHRVDDDEKRVDDEKTEASGRDANHARPPGF
jgi:hypothetical protein